MSTRITSNIAKARTAEQQWIAATAATDPDAEPSRRYLTGEVGTAPTWPEALTLAAEQRARIDARLMDEVHESRARRRVLTGQQLGTTPDQSAAHLHFMEATA